MVGLEPMGRDMQQPAAKCVWGAVVALALLWPTAAASAGQSGKLDRLLEERSSLSLSLSGELQDVIIRTKSGRKASVKNKVGRRTSHVREHKLIEAISARLTREQIAALAADPDVDGISADVSVNASGATDGYSTEVVGDVKQTLGLGNWFTGSSITVAIIDSGVAPGVDFGSRIVGQFVFHGGQSGTPSVPFDDYGHGTHVAGLIGSNGSSSNNKYAGIAPGSKILALKVLDKKGTGKTSDVIHAIEFAVANKARYGIKVINLSLGHPIYESAKTDPLVQVVEAAVRAGIVVVVAAGNYGYNPVTGATGYGGIASPGNAPSAITVGAAVTNNTVTRSDDRLATYSSRGPSWYDGVAKPDVLAPGQAMISNRALGSTLETDYPSLVLTSGLNKYLRLSGSSMATGVVSGLVAIMIEANENAGYQRWHQTQSGLRKNQKTAFVAPPALTSNAIKALLQYTATRIHDGSGAAYGPLEQGSGLVNGLGAVALAYLTDTTKAAGQYWMTFDMPPSTDFGGTEEAWAQTVIWGTRILRGTSVVDLNQVAWAENIVWGTGELNNIVSGTMSQDEEDNIVWGTLVEDDNVVWGTSVPLSTDLLWAGNAMLEDDNVVWGTGMVWDDNVVFGTGLIGYFDGFNIVWGTFSGDGEGDNIVWGTFDDDNVVWGTSANKVSVLGTNAGGGL
jgi:serine protease AprX